MSPAASSTLGFSKKAQSLKDARAESSRVSAFWRRIDSAKMDRRRIFHRDEIRRLCLRYRLRFLPASYYEGPIDPAVCRAWEQCKQKHGMLESDPTQALTYIMAPASTFRLQPRPKHKDPILFLSLGEDWYYLVHKWGGDLSRWRAFWTLPLRNHFLANLFIWLVVGGLASLLAYALSDAVSVETGLALPAFSAALVLALTAVTCLAMSEDGSGFLASENWESTFRSAVKR